MKGFILKICEKCGSEMIMYSREYCPKCYKPEMQIMYVYDLFECMYYVQAHGHEGFKEKLFNYLIECEYIQGNDTYIRISKDSNKPLLKELFQKMEIEEDSAIFFVSW
jgi:hypothetical protein